MPEDIKLVQSGIGDYNLKTLHFRGRPAWLSSEIGKILGYSEAGSRLTHKITNEWNKEFVEDVDYASIIGEDLANFKDILRDSGSSEPVGRLNKLYVLFESGLYLVLSLTHKPIGSRFRRLAAAEILPDAVEDPASLVVLLQALSEVSRGQGAETEQGEAAEEDLEEEE